MKGRPGPAVAPKAVAIGIDGAGQVSGLLQGERGARVCLVLAHGAGAGMRHPFMAAIAAGLAERGVATLRYQFPYMERRAKRPDPPKIAQAAVRTAVGEAARLLPGLPLFAGGKSFGGRMTSQAQSESPLPGVRGLLFLGFPLHPPGKASVERGEHLSRVGIPMLFLQGSRDDFADLKLLAPLVHRLGAGAALTVFPEADHSFHVPARSGRSDAEVLADIPGVLAGWMERVAFG
jgi:uncharacterized protein